jgi:metallo-beta-lactamase class B
MLPSSLLRRSLCAGATLLAGLLALPVAANEWTVAQQPFRVHGNTYYVGSRGLTALLLTSDAGHVLIDAPMTENAAMIEANIRSLGFEVKDVRLIVHSHPHFDHAGAIAALAAASGAKVRASAAAAKALRAGGNDADDPQYDGKEKFPPVTDVTTFADGEVLKVGDIAVTAHATPGHTPGSSTYAWRSCEGDRCLDFVYADSLTAFSNDTYRYADPAHPERLRDFRAGLAKIAGLSCDVLITPHPEVSGFPDRVARRDAGDADALVDAGACRAYARQAGVKLDRRVAEEGEQ